MPKPVGSLYGYQVRLKAEFDDPFALHSWPVPQGMLKTDNPDAVFDARTGFSLDSIVNGVALLGHLRLKDYDAFCARIARAGLDPTTTFLPFLMRRLVTKAVASRDLPDTHPESISVHWLLMAERVLMDMASVADRAVQDGASWSTHSMAMRTLQAQIHDQMDVSDYRRELWLTQQTTRRAYELGLDLDELYRDAYGLSVSQLAALSFAAHATAMGTAGATFNPKTWNRNGIIAMPPERIDSFFSLCSVDYEAFKELARSPTVAVPGYETYALSPLVRYPLVIRSDGLAVAPMLRDTLERPTRAFRIDVLQALGDRSGDVGRFNQAFGITYQEYVE